MLGFAIALILKLLVFWAGLVMPWGPVSGRNVGYFVIGHLLTNDFFPAMCMEENQKL